MKIALINILKILLRIIIFLRWYALLAFLYSRFIEELVDGDNTTRPSKRASHNKLTILVISAMAFRKDIDCIVSTNEFRMLRITEPWQTRLSSMFYYPSQRYQKFWPDYNPDHTNFQYKTERDYFRDFLFNFLKRLYNIIDVDCVISAHSRYIFDIEWGAVSTQLGVPHILIPRDSQMASSPILLTRMTDFYKEGLPKFKGEHIIIQSELDKKGYIDSGYVVPEKISSLGCPRMDNFIKKTKERKFDSKNKRKKIVFLPFIWDSYFEKADLFSFIYEVHMFFVHFALKYPELDVIIKPKRKVSGSQKPILIEPLKDSSVELEKVPNLIIRPDLDLHDLFPDSDVVCGFNTSALLEAAVIGLPVIIPYFKDLQNPKYDKRVFYKDAFDLFDIARDVKELESLILMRLQNPMIDKNVMEGREAMFCKFVSSLQGDATEKYVECIKRVVCPRK